MTHYTVDDFAGLIDNFDPPRFVNCLNYVISEPEDDKVCDIFSMMKILFTSTREVYYHIKNLMTFEDHNIYSIKIYFKFLLLDIEEKTKIFYYIQKINDLSNKITTKESAFFHEIINTIHELINDDIFNNFLEYTDNYNNYISLDLSKIRNIEYKKYLFLDTEYISYFINNINIFMRFRFFHELIYVLSNNPSYISMLETGETTITSTTEFFRRIESSHDKLKMIKKYIARLYRYQSKENQIILINELYDEENIPSFVTYEYFILCLIYDLTQPREHNNIEPYHFNNVQETYKYYKSLTQGLTTYFEVVIQIDHNLIDLLNNKHNSILSTRYNKYFESRLYKSLSFIHGIYEFKLNEMIRKKEELTNPEKKEFLDYLENILNQHYYDDNVRY